LEVILGGFMSIDGKVAPANRIGHTFTPFMKPVHKKILHKIRSEVDAIIVGVDTIIADDPLLTVREVEGKNPLRVILDSNARTPLNAKVLNTNDAPTLIATTKKASKTRIDALKNKSIDVIVTADTNGVDLHNLFTELELRGVKKILVEGGSTVRWSFFKENLVDQIFVWLLPYVWGGKDSPTLVDGEGFLKTSESIALKLQSMQTVDEIIILWFSVKH